MVQVLQETVPVDMVISVHTHVTNEMEMPMQQHFQQQALID
jgi:hypothetical protein